MKQVFPKVNTVCYWCGTPVTEKYKIGDKYACAEDYEKYYEKSYNNSLMRSLKWFTKVFGNSNG